MHLSQLFAFAALSLTSTRGSVNNTPSVLSNSDLKTQININFTATPSKPINKETPISLPDEGPTVPEFQYSEDVPDDLTTRHVRLFDNLYDDWIRMLTEIDMYIPKRCNSFNKAKTLFQKIQTDVPADGMRLTAEDYNKAIAALLGALKSMHGCKYTDRERELFPTTQLWTFDMMATHLIMTGMWYDLGPYHFMPSYLEGDTKGVFWDMMDTLDMDIRDYNWTTIWRGKPI